MTVSVRPWDQIAADLRNFDAPTYDMSVVRREAAVAGDALAAEVAKLNADRLEKGGSQLDETLKSYRAEHDRLAAVVAAVHAALDQYQRDCRDGKPIVATLDKCVSAIAKAVGR